MGKGLLAWWRRRIVARGLAGAALFAVPVVVAALIGFGTGFSGVAGGLSSVTNGPDAVPASAPTAQTRLNRAVVALASRPTTTNSNSLPSSNSSGGSAGSTGTSDASTGGGSTGTGDANSTGVQVPTIDTPTTPNITLPGSGSGGGATDAVNGAVNNVVGGVNNTLNGLLGGH